MVDSWMDYLNVDDEAEAERSRRVAVNQEGLIDGKRPLAALIPPVPHAMFRVVDAVLLVVLQGEIRIGRRGPLEQVIVVEMPIVEDVEDLQVEASRRPEQVVEGVRRSCRERMDVSDDEMCVQC